MFRRTKRSNWQKVQAALGFLTEHLEPRRLFAAVPAPLADTDVGTPTGGSASYDTTSHEFTITGAGYDIFGASDGFHYVYQALNGDGKVIARVDSDSADAAKSLAGLTIRSSLDPTAANLWVATRDTGQVFVDDRPSDGGTGTNVVTAQSPASFPIYLQIQRSGNSITASTSTDGTNFTPLITDTINLPQNALVGMAVSSQAAPTTLATATFGAFQVVPATAAPTAQLTSAPAVTGPQLRPYQFTVTYRDSTAINASTISNSNITVTGPGGYSQPATLVSTGLTNNGTVAAVYSVTGLTTPGQYAVNLNSNQVTNTGGQAVAGGVVGNFNFTADTTAPSGQVTSAPPITSATTAPYRFQVTYSDNNAIDASTLGNGNIIVTGPNGYRAPATLVSTGLTSGPTVAANYSINPLPTTPGTYTIIEVANQVKDLSGNAIAGGTVLGTFVVNSNSSASTGAIVGAVLNSDGRILTGATVFLDLAGTGVFQNGDPMVTTDTSSTFAFRNITPGTYTVVEKAPTGDQILEPASGKRTVTVAAGQIAFAPRFVDVPVNSASATADLTAAFTSQPASSVKLRGRSSFKLSITNNGTGTVSKRIRIAVLASTDGTIANKVDAVVFKYATIHLAAGKSQTVTISYRYPASITAGSYKLVAVLDPDGLVAESSKLNNTAVSGTVTVG